MLVRISTAAQNVAADGIAGLIDGGGAAGKLRVYDGVMPAGPDTAPGATLLLEFDLSDPAFAPAVSGSADLDVTPVPAAVGLAAGEATWCRFLTSTEAAGTGLGVFDADVSDTSGTGFLKLNTTTVSVGLDVSISSGTLTQPAS